MSPTKVCFYQFQFFLWWSIKFSQQNTDQSEAGIGDAKLSVELYEWGKTLDDYIGNIIGRPGFI